MLRRIQMMRFKRSGKYYDEVTFESAAQQMYELADEVDARREDGGEFIYLLTGKDSEGIDLPFGYPVLINQ